MPKMLRKRILIFLSFSTTECDKHEEYCLHPIIRCLKMNICFNITFIFCILWCIVSVLHQDEGGIGKSIPDAREISRDPRDFPRAKPEGNLEGRGKSRGRRGWISHSLIISREVMILTLSILPAMQGCISQYLPSLGGVRTFSHHQTFYREWISKSFPANKICTVCHI